MKFTTFLSLALHALLIYQFNPLLPMKRKNESISTKPAKKPKFSFDCPLIKQYCKKKNSEKILCKNNNGAGFEKEETLELHLLNFHHICPKCPQIHVNLQKLSDHIHHEHNIQTSVCNYCNNYIIFSSQLDTFNNHTSRCFSFEPSFSIEGPTGNRLQNKRVGNSKEISMPSLNWTNYGATPPPKNEIHKRASKKLNEQTGGDFGKNIFNFTVPQVDKTREQNSSAHSQQNSRLEVPIHHAPDRRQNAPQLVAYNTNQSSQYPLPSFGFFPNSLDLTLQENPQENNRINAQHRPQQVINIHNNIHNNYNIMVTPPTEQRNIPLNHPTTMVTEYRPVTESCGIEMPSFNSAPPEFYLNFLHLPGALAPEYMPWTLVACSSCPEKFTSRQDMKKHAVSAHLECPQLECTYKDSSATGLMVHTKEEHFHENVFIFPCLHCNAFAATDRQETIAHQQHCPFTPRYSYGNH